MQHRTKWSGIKWSGIKLSTLPFVLAIMVLARFANPYGKVDNARAEAQQTNLLLTVKQAQANASLNIYMPLIMLNSGSLAIELTVEPQTTAAMLIFTPPLNNAQPAENISSLNIYAPLIFQ